MINYFCDDCGKEVRSTKKIKFIPPDSMFYGLFGIDYVICYGGDKRIEIKLKGGDLLCAECIKARIERAEE